MTIQHMSLSVAFISSLAFVNTLPALADSRLNRPPAISSNQGASKFLADDDHGRRGRGRGHGDHCEGEREEADDEDSVSSSARVTLAQAESTLQLARARVDKARSDLDAARIALAGSKNRNNPGLLAGVTTAQGALRTALAGVQSARAAVEQNQRALSRGMMLGFARHKHDCPISRA